MGQTSAKQTAGKGYTYKGMIYSPSGVMTNSLFQDIANKKIPPSSTPPYLLHETSKCVIFAAKKGSSHTHLLVVPKQWVKSWKTLVEMGPGEGASLLKHLEETGRTFTSKEGSEYYIERSNLACGFHSPPFNSIDHLHLHFVDRSKFREGWKNRAKFPETVWTPWFKKIEDVFEDISKNTTTTTTAAELASTTPLKTEDDDFASRPRPQGRIIVPGVKPITAAEIKALSYADTEGRPPTKERPVNNKV